MCRDLDLQKQLGNCEATKMSDDTNRSAAEGTEELQKMQQEITFVSKSIGSAGQKINVKVEFKEQEDLLLYLELPAEEEKIQGHQH